MSKSKERQECFRTYEQIIDGLETAYSKNKINDVEFSQYKTKTLLELQESLSDLTDTSLTEYNENTMSNNYADFELATETTYFIPALVEQINQDYYSLEDGMEDIQEATGISDDEVIGLFTGDLVPTAKMVDILNTLFEATSVSNENALAMQVLAAMDRGELSQDEVQAALYELPDEDEDGDEDRDEDEDGDEEESTNAEAVYSYIDPRVQALESKIADFELNSELKSKLSEVAEFARQGIEQRWLSRAKYDLLLGSFEREEDRVAAFSQTAESNNVDLSTQLYAVLFALKADEECGDPRINFGSMVNESNFSKNDEESELAAYQIQKMIEQKQLFSKIRR